MNKLCVNACLLYRPTHAKFYQRSYYVIIDFSNGSNEIVSFGFDDITQLRRLKSICKPNFNKIY